jgi:hypothetical protein
MDYDSESDGDEFDYGLEEQHLDRADLPMPVFHNNFALLGMTRPFGQPEHSRGRSRSKRN